MTLPSEHIASILREARQERLVRFDADALVRVYVTQDDIEDDPRTRKLVASGAPPEEIVRRLKGIAQAIAQERMDALGTEHGGYVSVSLEPNNKTTDTVNWHAIASPEPEDDYSVER